MAITIWTSSESANVVASDRPGTVVQVVDEPAYSVTTEDEIA